MSAQRLEELRTAAFMTQEQLSEDSGVSRDTVSKIERGHRKNIHAITRAKLAAALGVEPWELQSRTPPEGTLEHNRAGDQTAQTRPRYHPSTSKVQITLSRIELHAFLYQYRTSLEMIPDNTPEEHFVIFEWLAFILQGHEYAVAYQMAHEKIYGGSNDKNDNPTEEPPGPQAHLMRLISR